MGIDCVGPLNSVSTKGNKYILTISDYFTKFVDAIPLPENNAHHVAAALFKVCNAVTILQNFNNSFMFTYRSL